MKVNDHRTGKDAAKKHLKQQIICKILGELAERVLMDNVGIDWPNLKDVPETIKSIVFRKKV